MTYFQLPRNRKHTIAQNAFVVLQCPFTGTIGPNQVHHENAQKVYGAFKAE